MKTLRAMVGESLDDKVRTGGCSANKQVFGKSPKVPHDLLSPDGQIQALQRVDLDLELRRRQLLRSESDIKIAEFTVNRELVAFWREPGPARIPRLASHAEFQRRGIVIEPRLSIGPHRGDPRQNNYWLSLAGRCILAYKEQLRPTHGVELDDVLQQVIDNPLEKKVDERGLARVEADAQDHGEVIPFYENADEEHLDGVPTTTPRRPALIHLQIVIYYRTGTLLPPDRPLLPPNRPLLPVPEEHMAPEPSAAVSALHDNNQPLADRPQWLRTLRSFHRVAREVSVRLTRKLQNRSELVRPVRRVRDSRQLSSGELHAGFSHL